MMMMMMVGDLDLCESLDHDDDDEDDDDDDDVMHVSKPESQNSYLEGE